jgi:hypothetical protein
MQGMLLMTGQLLNVFKTVKNTNAEGKEYGGQHKIQVLGAVSLPNGETQNKLVDLTCHDVAAFEAHQGKSVTFPVGVMAQGKGQVIYYIPKGAKPELVDAFGGKF